MTSPAYIEKHGSPETPEELLSHQALMQGTETWLATVDGKVITMRPQGRFKADNGVALVAAALAGIGIAALPNDLTREHRDSGALVPVMTHHPIPEHGIYVVRPPGQHPSRKIRVLTEMLIECFGHSSEGSEASRK